MDHPDEIFRRMQKAAHSLSLQMPDEVNDQLLGFRAAISSRLPVSENELVEVASSGRFTPPRLTRRSRISLISSRAEHCAGRKCFPDRRHGKSRSAGMFPSCS